MKKLFRVFFLTMILCLITALSASAKGSVTKLEKTVKPTGGSGNNITIITANKFLVDDYSFIFEFKENGYEFLSEALCRITINGQESDGWVNNYDGICFYEASPYDFDISAGSYKVNLELYSYYSDITYSTSFDIQFVYDMGTISALEGVAPDEKVTISKYANGLNVGMYMTEEFYPANVVLVNKQGVKYMGVNPDGYNEPNWSEIPNVFYSDIFSNDILDNFAWIDGYHYFPWLEQGRPLEAGIYDVWVYDEDGVNYTVLPDAVEVVDMPCVEVYETDEYITPAKIGDKKFSLGVATQGIDIDDITINLYDEKDNLFATSTGKEILINNYQENQYIVEMEAVNGFAYGRYEAEIVAKQEVMCESRVYFSDNSADEPYIYQYNYCEEAKANYILKIRNSNPTLQYKFELYDPSNVKISEVYSYVSEEGYADIEFTDKNGKVIDITPQKSYRIAFYYKNNGEWELAEKQTVTMRYSYTQSGSSSGGSGGSGGGATYLSGYASVYNGVVEGSLTMPQSMMYQYPSDSLFELRVLSITGDVYRFTPVCERHQSSNGTYYIWLEKTNANLPAGYYKTAIYYNSRVVWDYDDWFEFSESSYVWAENAGVNHTRYIEAAYSDAGTPVIKLYSILDGDFDPELEITMVKDGNLYVIPDSADFDKNHRYFYEITAGNSGDTDFHTGYYISTKTQPDTSKNCTITVKQTANGTTSVSNTNPKVGDIVYVNAKADDGYVYVPVSVKVNGVRIRGRSFTAFENATVEAEYTEIPKPLYKISVNNYSSYIEASVDKEYYKAGETVKVNVKILDNGCKLSELYYTINGNYSSRVDIDLNTKTFVMPESNIQLFADYDWKREYYIETQSYDDYYLYINGERYNSYAYEGDTVSVTAYLESTDKQLPASEFESLYYVLLNDPTGKQYAIYNGRFVMPDEGIKLYGKLRKRPIAAQVTGKGSVKFLKGYDYVTEAYATEQITVEGVGEGSFELTSIEVNGVPQTSTTFEMPAGSLKLKANFTSDEFVKVNILPCENGTVTIDKSDWEYSDGLDYSYYRGVDIKIVADNCYKVKSLTINGIEHNVYHISDDVYTYNMTDSIKELVVEVEFEQTHYEVTYVDDKNQVITKQYYALGTMGNYNGFTPYKAPDKQFAYIFTGWDKASVSGPDVVKASFEPVEYKTISTEEELKAMESNGYYVLANDITLTEKWKPIVNFKGTLDGCGHIIKNISTDIWEEGTGSTSNYNIGFILLLEGNVINTGFEVVSENLNIDRTLNIGTIALTMNGARIENCYVSGALRYNRMDYCGLIAYHTMNDSIIRNCYTDVVVEVIPEIVESGICFGGLVSWGDESTKIYSSYNNSSFKAPGYHYIYSVGNLDYNATIEKVYCNTDKFQSNQYTEVVRPATTNELSTLKYFYNGADYELDFASVWGLDSEINDGLPSLKMFGTNPAKATSTVMVLETGEIKATVKFSQPVAGEMFTLVRSGNKSSFKQINCADVVDSLDLTIESKKIPDEAKVIVWENFANIKPVVMETLNVK